MSLIFDKSEIPFLRKRMDQYAGEYYTVEMLGRGYGMRDTQTHTIEDLNDCMKHHNELYIYLTARILQYSTPHGGVYSDKRLLCIVMPLEVYNASEVTYKFHYAIEMAINEGRKRIRAHTRTLPHFVKFQKKK